MQTKPPAIKVTRAADGWTWTVIDGHGQARANGAAGRQQDAMEAAWLAARSSLDHAPRVYPEIIIAQECVDG
jgi:hypothetical protein